MTKLTDGNNFPLMNFPPPPKYHGRFQIASTRRSSGSCSDDQWHPWEPHGGAAMTWIYPPGPQDASQSVTNEGLHHWKLTWHWKIPIFNRKYIFKWWMFHCHVSFLGGRLGFPYRKIRKKHEGWMEKKPLPEKDNISHLWKFGKSSTQKCLGKRGCVSFKGA